MKNKRTTLFHSIISLLLCVSMLVGTTFAWFTDSVKTGINTIASGVLDVELYHSNGAVNNERVENNTKLFMDLQGEPILWEPGVVSYENLRVSNEGDLALSYQLAINTANENYIVDPSGAIYSLSQVLKVGVVEGGITANDRTGVLASVNAVNWTTLADFLRSGGLMPEGKGVSEKTWGVVIYWQPGENDNLWNLKNGKYLNEGEELSIDLGIHLEATQEVNESDAFGRDYDITAAHPKGSIDVLESASVLNNAENGVVVAPVSVGNASSGVAAKIPEGVVLAEGTTELTLSVKTMETSQANIALENGETKTSLDVHIEGVAQGNTVPMLITLKHYLTTGINTGALKLYHVENDVPVAMTQVAAPVNHNEFSYDPATGDVTLALASFSEVAVVADTNNTWNGTAQAFTQNTDGTYSIYNAGQLAYFRDIVDGKTVVEGIDPTFAGKTVKLENNITLSKVNFDPIGWGYEYNDWNVGDVAGKPFKGTFDGGQYDENGKLVGRNTIFDLYQSGWDLEDPDEDGNQDADYTYTNCGFGLFASAADATFRNLTISGANIVTECVEMGVLVGLSQGNCTYENINIHNSKIANYQRPTGGLIGEVSPLNGGDTTTITNVTIGSDVVVGSLWGDFDAPCGGVIGARWDDANVTQVKMENVTVACRLDVYNDVTSTYQWYAYRRAGMLIGNTEQADGRTATAPFLTCEKVKVYYAPWVKYHYCEFNNHNSSWPWVRVEAGENCTAFSNPRYGVPNDPVTKQPVTSLTHNHSGEDGHNVELEFNQLYGGGQGVYGQPKHPGVEVINYRYSITYVNDNQVLAIKYVTETGAVQTENATAQDLVEKWASENITGNWEFGGWMNAGSTKLTEIDANNTKDIVLYPYFNNPYTARFVDQQGNVIAYCFFRAGDLTKLDGTKATAQAALPDLGEDLEFDHWEVQITDNEGKVISTETYNTSKFAGYKKDVTIYPVYTYNGDVQLIPVDSDSDGIINYYQVGGYSNPNGQALVEIPASVNGIPILQINEKAFASYDGVHSIVIPTDVTYIGNNAFAEKWGTLDKGESVTIYYAGSYADWVEKEKSFGSNWESGISGSSKIFFLNGGNTVDVSQGYLQAKASESWGSVTGISWTKSTITSPMIEDYTGYCDCAISTTGDTAHTYVDANGNVMGRNDEGTPINANGTIIEYKRQNFFSSYKLTTDFKDTYYRYRPDAIYWKDVTIN